MDEAIEIVCNYEDKTSIESFHGPEPENYDILSTPALNWIFERIKSTIRMIKNGVSSIMKGNGLTD